jgi:hypothetical protein
VKRPNLQTITLGKFDIDVEFNFYKGEKRTWEYPGSADEFEIVKVHIYGNGVRRNQELRINQDKFINKHQEEITEMIQHRYYEN